MPCIISGYVQCGFKRFDVWALSQFVSIGQIDCAVQFTGCWATSQLLGYLLGLLWLCMKALVMFLPKSLDDVGSLFQACSRWSQSHKKICRKKKMITTFWIPRDLSWVCGCKEIAFCLLTEPFPEWCTYWYFVKCGMSITVNRNQHLKRGLFILLYDMWWTEVLDVYM